MKDFLPELLNACVPLIIVLFVILTTLITTAIVKIASYLKLHANNDLLNYAITTAESSAIVVVQSLNQTIVNDLKAASEDGKLTPEEANAVLEDAVNKLKLTMSGEVFIILQEAYGNLDDYLRNLIESMVLKCKQTEVVE